jgi:DNA-binding SARP family transcriptional activator
VSIRERRRASERREVLRAGRYRRVAELLHKAQAASETAGDAILADILAAARRICLALAACQAEVEWHQRACEEADQREHELKQQLHAILDLVTGREAPETPEMWSAVPTTDLSQPERDTHESAERPSLWQRIQSLLGWRAGAQSPQREVPVVSAGAPMSPSAEKTEVPAAPLRVPERETATVSPIEKERQGEQVPPALVVYCLGPFRMYQDEHPVEDWPSSKGKCIFKYLVTHRQRPVAKEVLMELFWPGAHPDAARNNLNVAIYGLRQALREANPSFSHVLFQDDCYLLDPDLQIWVDCEAFMEHLTAARGLERRGELVAAVREYRAAEALYQGEFLEEDRYQDWPIPQRRRFQRDYLSVLDRLSHYYSDQEDYTACGTVCRKMLAVDACREEAHRRLMRCYSRQGQHYLALRQYHLCVETLQKELDVPPMDETLALYQRIRAGEAV